MNTLSPSCSTVAQSSQVGQTNAIRRPYGRTADANENKQQFQGHQQGAQLSQRQQILEWQLGALLATCGRLTNSTDRQMADREPSLFRMTAHGAVFLWIIWCLSGYYPLCIKYQSSLSGSQKLAVGPYHETLCTMRPHTLFVKLHFSIILLSETKVSKW